MQTFNKNERLISKVIIDDLFEKGKSFNSSYLKIIWKELPQETHTTQVLFSVPKRIYKRAVDRNKVKRLMREAYRKNKSDFYEKLNGKTIGFIFIYLNKTIIDYKEMEDKIIVSLQRLNKEIN